MTAALLLVSVPFLTALALAALRSEALAERIDRWVVTLGLPATIGLAAWSGGLDRLGLLGAGLVWGTAALARWGEVPSGHDPTRGNHAAARALDQMVLGGLLLTCLVAGGTHGVAVWAAMVVVVGASVAQGLDGRENPMAGAPRSSLPSPHPSLQAAIPATGLMLLLFGTITAPLQPPFGLGCQIVGLAILLALIPALLPVALPLLLRLGAETGSPPLLAAGLAGLTLAAIAVPLRLLPDERGAVLAQMALAAAAIGLGTPEGGFAALILLTLLTISDAAARLHDRARPVALLALVGLPPLGTFAGLALVLPEIAHRDPLLLPLCLFGIAVPAWWLIRRATTRRPIIQPALGWLPIGAALAIGLLMPAPVTLWLRSTLPPIAITATPAP